MAAGNGLTRRLFLAIDLDEPCRNALERLIDQLGRCIDADKSVSRGRVKWVEPRNLHLTVRFLGATAESQLHEIQASLGQPLAARSFDMWFDRLGVFPARGAPRAIWVGASAGAAEAEHVQQELERRLIAVGVPSECRPFRVHLTVGRFRSSGRSSDRRAIRGWVMEPVGPLLVDHVTLYESHLSTGAPSYVTLVRVPLKMDAIS